MTRKCNPMKRICVIGLSVVILLGLIVTHCLAVDPEADEKFKNGVPFATLAAEISANTTAIDALQAETTNLATSLQLLMADVAGLTTRVTANESAIAAIQNTLSDLGTQVANNFSQLQGHATTLSVLQQDVQTNAEAIAGTQANIDALEETLTQQLTDMGTNMTNLSKEFDTLAENFLTLKAHYDAQFDTTQAQIAALFAEITALKEVDAATLVEQATQNANINDALNQIATLQQSLLLAQSQLDNLKDQVGSLWWDMYNSSGKVAYFRFQFEYHFHHLPGESYVTEIQEHWWGIEWWTIYGNPHTEYPTYPPY